MFSHSDKYNRRSKRKLTTRWQTRQCRLLLKWNKVSAFTFCNLRNSTNKYCFVALYSVVADHFSTSVQAVCELIISCSLLVIAWNKHEWTSKGILFQPRKDVNTHYFSPSSNPPMLIYFPVWFVCWTKMADSALWLVRLPVNQTPGKGSVCSPLTIVLNCTDSSLNLCTFLKY